MAIVGGGIAGTTIAWQAYLKGYDVTLFNKDIPNSPSKVAAGIINPVTISRKKAIFKGEIFAKEAWAFYKSMPNYESFVHDSPIHIRIRNIREHNDWVSSSSHENGLVEFLSKDECTIKWSGWIDSKKLITNGLSNDKISIVNEEVRDFKVLSQRFDYVVLATGILPDFYKASLREDAFRPVLGDVLMVKLDEPMPFSHLEGAFVIPLKDEIFCIGSTYIHDFEDSSPSLERAKQLITKVELQGIKVTELLSFNAAIRPAVYDRAPLIGKLGTNVYSFTGMGSRALLHAPLLAEQLLDLIEAQKPLSKVVDIKRALV